MIQYTKDNASENIKTYLKYKTLCGNLYRLNDNERGMRMKKKLILLLLFLLITMPNTTVRAAKKVKLSPTKIILVKGQKKTIKLQNTKSKPTWSSKSKKIATVKKKKKASAIITAKKKGTTYIYAKLKGKKYKCKVSVETPVLKTNSITLKVKETQPILLSGTKQKITYKSSNAKVATVNKKGIVTGKTSGLAIITITLASGKKYTCTVNIISPSTVKPTPGSETAAVDAGEYSIGRIHTGDGTYYDGGYTGGCAKLDAIAGAYYVAAINKIDYRAGCLAGAYLEVTGPSGKSVNVLITDTLADGEGQKGDIDLNQKAFEQIEPLATGRMKVTWQILPLPTNQPIQYVYEPTSTRYWMQVQVRNHRYPVKKLEIQKADGSWQELPREEYNYFTLNQPGSGPYTFRVTDIYGHVLTDTNIPLSTASAVNGAANFPY